MATGSYIGLSSKARKVTKGYIGVSSKARKVTKGYIGINGKARLFYVLFKNYTLRKASNNAPDMFVASSRRGAGSTETHAILAGGEQGSNKVKNAEAYNTDLVHTELEQINSGIVKGSIVGQYAIFAAYVSSSEMDVFAYNDNLIKTTASAFSRIRTGFNSSCNNSYAIFAGSSTSSYAKYADAYDTSLVLHTTPNLSVNRENPRGTNLGEYAIFGAGLGQKTIEAYDTSLTRISMTDLSGNYADGACSTKEYAFYATMNASINAVDIYDSELVKQTTLSLSQNTENVTGQGNDHFALFAGGTVQGQTGGFTNFAECFDNNLVRTTLEGLTTAVYLPTMVKLGKSETADILVAGGRVSSSYGDIKTVNIYETVF